MHQTLSAESGPYKLEARLIHQDAETLVLQYVFHNQGQQTAYLFNKLYKGLDEQGRYKTGPDLTYVEIDALQATISKKIVPVPKGMKVEKPTVPCVTRVRAGEKFEETVSLWLPLRTWTPYSRDAEATGASSAVRPLWFEIGFFSATAEGDALAKTVQTTDGPALHFYPFPVSSQRLLRVGPLLSSVPVLIFQ